MKKFLMLMSMVMVAASFAAAQDDCCKAEAKVEAKIKVTKKDDCCGDKKVSAEDAFMAEARRMAAAAEGKQDCCKSTPEKPVAKGEAGCCNAKGEVAKFKVFVAGEGYKYFGCEGSAGKGRTELMSKGKKVGKVQKVHTKVTF